MKSAVIAVDTVRLSNLVYEIWWAWKDSNLRPID
jgi:hypothetical protein